jgi:hypothetical protein
VSSPSSDGETVDEWECIDHDAQNTPDGVQCCAVGSIERADGRDRTLEHILPCVARGGTGGGLQRENRAIVGRVSSTGRNACGHCFLFAPNNLARLSMCHGLVPLCR